MIGSDYYLYLLDQIGVLHGDRMNYLLLSKYLYSTVYEPRSFDTVICDSGLKLRSNFASDVGVDDTEVDNGPCTVLEMLLGIASEISYIYGDDDAMDRERWFWELLSNLGLDKENDSNYSSSSVANKIEVWMFDRYTYNGHGGIFPLNRANRDQRKLRIMAQMMDYINENYSKRF